MTRKRPKPAAPAEEGTLGSRAPGDTVELVAATQEGGWMYERTLPAGTRCRVAWHVPRGAPEWTFVEAVPGRPVSCPSSARVRLVARRSVEAGPVDDGGTGDLLDPMNAGAVPLLERITR